MKSRYHFACTAIAVVSLALRVHPAGATDFSVQNLVTDDQTVNAAQTTDSNLVNAWGVSYSPTGPFWVSDNRTGVSTHYNVNPATNATSKVGLTVTIPGDGSVTGQAFNGSGGAFNGDLFLFANEDGMLSGWRGALGTNAEVLQTASVDNSYKGTAIGQTNGHSYLYAADFKGAAIDILKGDAAAPNLAGTFTDPNLPAGFAPFNIANLNGTLYVTYAVVGATGDDVPGIGNGLVDTFDLQGNFLARIATPRMLNSPWRRARAPPPFGEFAGDLLVGNFGDGTIHAYDLATKTLDGMLEGPGSTPIVIAGLWALIPGNGGMAGDPNSIYFSAGPVDESHGLFGVIVPEPATGSLIAAGLLVLAGWRRARA